MAAIPQRERSLEQVVNSILPQCDELNVYLNNWDHTPEFLKHKKINAYRSEEELGDLGDVGKFYKISTQKGYIFTVDDDFIYPADYAARMIEAIDRYKRKAVVSLHGRLLKKKSSSYYKEFDKMYAACHTVPVDAWVHEVGTGVTAFHSDTIVSSLDMFPYTNMSDILFSMELQRRKIPMLVIAHKSTWLKGATKHNQTYGIYWTLQSDDKWITDFVNDFNWHLHVVE